MNGVDIYTILFLALAVVVIFRLRSVLGRRTGNERPPLNPLARGPERRPATDKVVMLPRAGNETKPIAALNNADVEARIKAVAPAGGPVAAGLKTIMAADPSFDPKTFVDGGRIAYEMVVTAFAEGDRRQLRQLLAREVYDGFVAAIGQREARQEKIEFKFVGIDRAEITEALLKGPTAQVTVRFVSQLISATRDKDGKVIDGDDTKVTEVTDIWTFAHDVGARDPNWKLIATESVD